MKAISLWQPWASLWLSPRKVHETRHWPTDHRGPLCVHAAKRLVTDCGEELDEICISEFGALWRRTLPRGALLGTVDLIDCLPTNARPMFMPMNGDDLACGDFSADRYGWRRDSFSLFDKPIPYIGRQGFFQVPDAMLAERNR